jgi:hypothetical protein
MRGLSEVSYSNIRSEDIFMPRTFSIILFILITSWIRNAGAEPLVERLCGIESCQGLEITCGPNVPQVCTAMYRLGDFCRAYVRCEVVDKECRLITDERFLPCKACVEACSGSAGPDAFKCEAMCREKIEGQVGPGPGVGSTKSVEQKQ